jgi:hypothetical protein
VAEIAAQLLDALRWDNRIRMRIQAIVRPGSRVRPEPLAEIDLDVGIIPESSWLFKRLCAPWLQLQASFPRAQGAARWTQARIGAALGVDRSTVTRWFEDTSNVNDHKASKPPKPKDKRVKVAVAEVAFLVALVCRVVCRTGRK